MKFWVDKSLESFPALIVEILILNYVSLKLNLLAQRWHFYNLNTHSHNENLSKKFGLTSVCKGKCLLMLCLVDMS